MTTDDLLQRSHDAAARLGATRPAVVERSPWPLAARFDDAPEAEWGPVEVLAHVAEMIPFWQGEMERIIVGVADGTAEPIPFGRVATDTVRLAVLERDRTLPPAELYDRIAWSLDRLERRWSTLTEVERGRIGLHPRLGEMTIAAIIVRFIVAHVEDHAVQLETTLGLGPMES
jgi:hypothetical protein